MIYLFCPLFDLSVTIWQGGLKKVSTGLSDALLVAPTPPPRHHPNNPHLHNAQANRPRPNSRAPAQHRRRRPPRARQRFISNRRHLYYSHSILCISPQLFGMIFVFNLRKSVQSVDIDVFGCRRATLCNPSPTDVLAPRCPSPPPSVKSVPLDSQTPIRDHRANVSSVASAKEDPRPNVLLPRFLTSSLLIDPRSPNPDPRPSARTCPQ